MVKVLVVEDDAMLRSILVKSLTGASFEVRANTDGFEAELETKTWHPDIVLLDLLLPEEDGFNYLRKIRADTDTFKTNVIVLSNLSGTEVISQVKKFGVSEYFIKANVSPSEIVEKLKSITM